MKSKQLVLGNCRFEVLLEDDKFIGLGSIFIGETAVRSGRLPLRPYTQTFQGGLELSELRLRDVQESPDETRIRLLASFRPLPVHLMRDHSFDPIHDAADWDQQQNAGEGLLDVVLRPARDTFNGVSFAGFSYHYEYSSEQTPLFYIFDKASWELDGNIEGATAYSQSSCSAPLAEFDADTVWSTEGIIHFDDDAAKNNPVMTHNLPRWASHGSFDFQFKNSNTLIGVFERVELIRSLLKRDAGKAELKTFDKHIFDQTLNFSTSPKKILLNNEPKSKIAQRNLWTWIFDEVHERARAEFGLNEELPIPRVSQNYWHSFTIESYYKDLLPATAGIGARAIFIDNMNKSDMTEKPDDVSYAGNMCCGHEYEPAEKLGGPESLKRFVEKCAEHQIQVYSWTNNDQSYLSPLNADPAKHEWFVKMEDARLKYGGAYTNVFTILDFKEEEPLRYWVDSLKKTKAETGLSGYLFDSFYNLGFMPVDYSHMTPTTQWRELLHAFKELQAEDIHFLIESFGPFGQVQHGCPRSYSYDNIFLCYRVDMGTGYTTVPTGEDTAIRKADDVEELYARFAHMAQLVLPLFIEGQRIDTLWTERHKQALLDYHNHYQHMHKRYLQEDGQGVIWHDRTGERATLWNFTEREVVLPGSVYDATSDQSLPASGSYRLEPNHTYVISGAGLPVKIESASLR